MDRITIILLHILPPATPALSRIEVLLVSYRTFHNRHHFRRRRLCPLGSCDEEIGIESDKITLTLPVLPE